MLLSKPGPLEKGHLFANRTTSRLIDRQFQTRYLSMLLAAVVIGSCAALIPVYYFLEDNYRIFFEIASAQAPTILDHLERERIWVQLIIAGGALINLVFFSIISIKMTNRVIGPVIVLKNHLRLLCRGFWNQPPIKVRDQDEFQDLIESYNYFFLLLRAQLEKERELLLKIKVDPRNTDAHQALEQLLTMRSIQFDRDLDSKSEVVAS